MPTQKVDIFKGFNLLKTDIAILQGLYAKNLLTQSHLQILLDEWKKHKVDLIEHIVDLGFLNSIKFNLFCLEEFEITEAKFDFVKISETTKNHISFKACSDNGFLPFFENETEIFVAVRLFLEDDISKLIVTDKKIKLFYLTARKLNEEINKFYFTFGKSKILIEQLNNSILNLQKTNSHSAFSVKDPIINLSETIFEEAIFSNASEIYFELNDKILRIRFKITGVFHEVGIMFNEIGVRLLNRIKIFTGINISDFSDFKLGEMSFQDYKMKSVLSFSAKGESLSVFITKPLKNKLTIADLKLSKTNQNRLKKLLNNKKGGIWIAGRKHSGLSASLNMMMQELGSSDSKVLLIDTENKFNIPNAVSIKGSLNSALVQSPDLLGVDNVAKEEIIPLISANLDGIQTVATTHAIDGISLLYQLIEIFHAKKSLIAGMNAIIGQKIIRTLCEYCKDEIPITTKELASLKLSKTDVKSIYKHAGCEKCHHTGYLGTISLFEIIIFDLEIEEYIASGKSKKEILDLLKKKGFISIFEDARLKVLQGITDIEEILR